MLSAVSQLPGGGALVWKSLGGEACHLAEGAKGPGLIGGHCGRGKCVSQGAGKK